MSDIIISNETRPFHWVVDETAIYVIMNGKLHQVKTFIYIANGTGDLCSVTDENDDIIMKVENEIKTTDTFICAWEDDILICQFFERLPPPINRSVLYLEVNDSLFPFIDTVFRLYPSTKSDHYDAYLGRRYPSLEQNDHLS